MDNPADSLSSASTTATALPGVPPPAARRTVSGRIARWVLAAVLLANVLVGGTVWVHAANAQAAHVSADLSARLATLQTTLAHSDLTDPATLATLAAQIAPARADMDVLVNDLPFGGRAPFGPWAASAHALHFGIASADAAQAIIATALDLGPSLIGLRDSVLRGPSPASGAAHHLLTLSDVHAAQGTLQRAISYWYVAQAARGDLSPGDIAASPLPGLGAFVQRFDQISSTASYALTLASALLDASPGLLGLDTPGQVLVVETNPDIARPTGGAIAHYGVLTFAQGALSAPMQLATVAALDCPHAVCPNTPLPPSATWAPLSNTQVQLRDANLDPELQISGYVMLRDFTSESGISARGMIVVTPTLAADVLGAIGPVTVPTLHTTFTAANALAWISYFHRNPVVPAAHNKSIAVDVDALLTQAIMAQLPNLSISQRTALGRALVQAMATKDLQFYSPNTRIEDALLPLGWSGSVYAPPGDSLYLLDTNVTGLQAGPFIHESATDSVTLDAEGGATHELRITYQYDGSPQGIPASSRAAQYTDVVRAVLPNLTVNQQVVSGCALVPATQAFHSVLACQFSLAPGQRTTLTLSWYVPNVFTPPSAAGTAPPASGTAAPPDYRLLVQRQPGSTLRMRVVVAPPTTLLFAEATAPGRLVAGQLQWTATPLAMDTALEVSFVS